MKSFNEKFSLNQFDKYCRDDFAIHLMRMWMSNGKTGETGAENFFDISSKLLILGKCRKFNYMSDVLFVGADTMAAEFLGDEYHRHTPEFEAKFTNEYDKVVGAGQQSCFESFEPIYDLISSEISDEQVMFERLLLPIKTKAHAIFLLCYAMPIVKPGLNGSQSSGEYRQPGFQQRRYYSSPGLLV